MILAFEIGGTRIRASRAQAATPLVPLGECPTPAEDFVSFVNALRSFLRGGEQGVALSIPGGIDPETGRITIANLPCLAGRCLAAELETALGLPVLILNDADCFVLAETLQGVARGHRSVLGIILGTGVGGGLLMDGRLVSGPGGISGEWGHGPVIRGPLAMKCGCGQTGCLETIGGARGLERLHALLSGETVDAQRIVAAWDAANPSASATVAEWLALISGHLAQLVNLLGITVIPVGGGVSNATKLIRALDDATRAACLHRPANPLVLAASVGADAGLVGAAEAGLQAFRTNVLP